MELWEYKSHRSKAKREFEHRKWGIKPEETHYFHDDHLGVSLSKSFMKSKRTKNYEIQTLELDEDEEEVEEEANYFVEPDSWFKRLWTLMMFFMSITSSFQYATYASLSNEIPFADQWQEGVYLVDIILNFISSFKDPKTK